MALKQNWCESLVNIDALTYAGNLHNLKEIQADPRYRFVHLDLNSGDVDSIVKETEPDVIIHFAAESHVDRSIEDPGLFLKTNIIGTFNLLNAAKNLQTSKKGLRFVMVSTDEVYGSLEATGQFFEETPFAPRSPYSVSKASADMLATAYHHTFNLQTMVVRCSNNYGPNQFPEKLIPQSIIFALQDRSIPVYGKGTNVRDWIYVEDFVAGIQTVIARGKSGEAYNFGGRSECSNIEVVEMILASLKKPSSLIQFVKDRKGHDFRYSMNFDKAERELNWRPTVKFETGLKETIKWYQSNLVWWEAITSGEYLKFYERNYGEKLVLKGRS